MDDFETIKQITRIIFGQSDDIKANIQHCNFKETPSIISGLKVTGKICQLDSNDPSHIAMLCIDQDQQTDPGVTLFISEDIIGSQSMRVFYCPWCGRKFGKVSVSLTWKGQTND